MIPKLYSKLSIGLSAIFLAPFFGSILFAYNLREIGKGRFGAYFIVASLLWNFVMLRLAVISHTSYVQYLVTNAAGAFILSFYYWDRFFGSFDEFQKKNPLKPILIYLAICSIPIIFFYLEVYGSRVA